MIKPHPVESIDQNGHRPAVCGTRDRGICTSHATAAEQCYITFIAWLNPLMCGFKMIIYYTCGNLIYTVYIIAV